MYRFVAIICTCTDIISLLKFHDRLLIFLRLTLLLIIFDVGHEHPTFAIANVNFILKFAFPQELALHVIVEDPRSALKIAFAWLL